MSEEITYNDDEINSVDDYHEAEKQDEHHSKLYWIQKNLRSKFANWAKSHKLFASISILFILGLTFYLRAYIHPIALGFRKYFVLIISILFIIWIIRRILRKKKKLIRVIGNILLIGIVFLGYLWGPPIYRYIGLYYHYKTINKKTISELPLTEQERIHPLNSIRTRLNQDGLPELSEATLPHIIVRKDGRLDFSMCVGPSTEYVYQRLTKNMNEIVSVPANAYNPDFATPLNRTEVNFDIGENLALSSNAYTAAIKKLGAWQFFNYEPDEVKFFEREENDWVQVITLTKWIGFFIPRPVFGGVIVIEQLEKNSFGNFISRASFGKGTFISPEDIAKYDYLKNQNLLSDNIARFTAESFRFQNGFLAPMPGYHNNDIRIPEMPTDQNQQPFVTYFNFKDILPSKNGGLYHYFGLEPYQKDKKTLSTSIFIPSNGHDNTVYYYDHANHGNRYIGSSSVADKVVDSKKNYDWSSVHPAETRPYIKMIDGRREFFWLSTIVTRVDDEGKGSFAGTNPELTLSNAGSGDVFWIQKKNLYAHSDSAWVTQIQNHESY
jgi:hypothetical protein